ncbi:MAG: phosphate acyltransferase [Bacteroidales bacterium]|nr:phosphate acyltransferase [Bacteroidales bacterium]MCF8349993.1 phosphate acyltransferase [Bacteroidales bacterium]MCF8376735.1 phosphate acyltransferase [Bacteroidales bacterium]
MRIGLDVMGGDYAPESSIRGAIKAQKTLPASDRLVLFGEEEVILEQLNKEKADSKLFDIVHCPETIRMNEHALKAYSHKQKSSIGTGFRYLKAGKIDTFSGAGNSGAMVVGSMYTVNTIQGIIRPCTSVILPKENGGITILLDVGTNPDPKPDVMYQFGIIGSVYASHVHEIDMPRVGLLNIGEEEEKGNLLTQHVFQLMKDSKDFNFIGNVEGRDLMNDKADVIVTDGFTGNVVLKQIEAMYQFLMKRNYTDTYIDRLNYEIYGGTPILGINAPVVLGHGISTPLAVKNMLLLSKEVCRANLSDKIKKVLSKYQQDES